MQEQLDAGAIIEAPVIDHNKGGLIVDCGIRGFVPISQIVDFPRRPQNEQPRDAAQEIAEKLQPYVGRKLRLKILEVNRKANRLILSEKVALYEERREKRDELFSSLQVGQKVTGSVRSIAPFGVFVDLGGIDGLVHKSELSWNKVNNPEAGYRVGEEVEAEVIDINHERGRISLSIRRLQPDPWHSTVADMNVGDVIDGTVTKIVNFGAFVRVRDGLEGLIHISELSHARVAHPGDVVHEGQTIKLKIISLDQERHRLGLSLKQAEEAPARPEATTERRERRPRAERGPGYDISQAVQEPEGGIDNTLAAAFAQVRQQIEETEAARTTSDTTDEADAGAEATAQAEPAAEAPEAVLAEEPAQPEAVAQADLAPALEVGGAEAEADTAEADAAEAKPARKRTAKAKAEPAAEAEAPAADAEAAPAADAEPVAEAAPAADAEAEAEPEAAAGAAVESEATTAAEAEPAAEAEAEPEAAADATAESDSQADVSASDSPESEGSQPAAEADATADEASQSSDSDEPKS
jgi:small subunit ribosomal protein S1